MIRYDDVGSLPLPEGVGSEEFEKAFPEFEDWALRVYEDSMRLKIDAGVQVPCYPQLRDMNKQFLKILNDADSIEEPYLIYEDKAELPEIEALAKLDLDLQELKICVTGPLELTLSEFGGRIYEDVMINIARSLNRFVEKSESKKVLDVQVVSIDEPSIGINPEIDIDYETLVEAWNIVGDTSADVQIHLHSPVEYEIACESGGIDIIDIGMAGTPKYFDSIDPDFLERHEKKLRAGISRSDVLTMASEYNEEHNVNIWTNEKAWNDFLEKVEPPSKILGRIEKFHESFGDLIKYVGPDCGLGGAKKVDLARRILENTSMGIESFLDKR